MRPEQESAEQQRTDQERAEQVGRDLRRLALFAEQNPHLAQKIGRQKFLLCFSWADNPAADMADVARRARRAGATTKKEAVDQWAAVNLFFGSLCLQAYADRAQVCERVVVGTHQETVTEPDPKLLAAVPEVTRQVTVEDVEWRCAPLLAAVDTKEVSA